MSTILEVTTGGVTTRGSGSLDLAAFYRRTTTSSLIALQDAERDPKSEIKGIGSVEVTPSGASQTGKKWVQKRNEYPDGSYLKLNVRTTNTALRFSSKVANLYLRIRSTAALCELAVICPTDANSSRSRVYVIGRFDVLTPEQVKERGLNLSMSGADETATYDELEDSTIFELEVKEKQILKQGSAKTLTIKSASGQKKIVPKLRMARRINLRP